MSLTNFSICLNQSTLIVFIKFMWLFVTNQIVLFWGTITMIKFVNNIVSWDQSYKDSTIVIYHSRVVPDLKMPQITNLEL